MNSGWTLPEKAFQWIENNIPFGSNIIELGSGHGSIRLSKNYNLWSVEHDEQWLNISSSNYIHAEIVEFSKDGIEGRWYNPKKITDSLPSEYSLLIIDGPPSTIGREGILANLDIFNWDCFVLIDDTHRSNDKRIANEIMLQKSLNELSFTEYFEPANVNREFVVLSSSKVIL
jgi:hypothetical protein